MNWAKKLYELQQIDMEGQSYREALEQINLKIGVQDIVLKAKTDLDETKKHLDEVGQKRRDLEWELEDLQRSVSKLSDKLYGGKVGSPKELLSLEQEVESFKLKVKQEEDEFLELLDEEEVTQKGIRLQTEQVEKLELEWQHEQAVLIQKQDEGEQHLNKVENERRQMADGIDTQALSLYEGLRSRKGQPAVVKVEQGRCQGCRITLSINELERARTGALVQCGSCGKILYLE